MVFSRYFDERDKNTGQPWWSFAQERGIDAASMALGSAWAEHVERQKQDAVSEPAQPAKLIARP